MEILPLGCDALVGVSNLVTPTGLGVARFELCGLQKCYVMMQIAPTCLRMPHARQYRF